MILNSLPLNELAALNNWARKELAREDLTEYCAYVDPTQSANYRQKHLRKIADALERVESGEIKRLFITAPPRHWKSSLVSEKFPQWFLGRNSTKTVGLTSNAALLAEGFSRNVRDMIGSSSLYRELFPNVAVNPDFSAVKEWALLGAHRSSCKAVGVGGAFVGKGAHLMIIDDPVADFLEANSRTQREAVWNWYRETIRDRLEPDGAIILVMSRWHSDDLAGRLMAASKSGDGEPWSFLHLPAICDSENDALGRQIGEALWSERYPVAELEKIKRGTGARGFAAKYQGNPRPDDGNILDHTLLVMVEPDQVPRVFDKIVRRWDLAFSVRHGADWVAGMKMGKTTDGKRYLLHLSRHQGKWPQTKKKIIKQAIEDEIQCVCAIESNGTQLGYYDDISSDERMTGRTVSPDVPEGDKEMRASVWGSRLEDRIIYCVRAEWNTVLFEEMDAFPNSDHDDVVDSISGGWKLLGEPDGGFSTPDSPPAGSMGAQKYASRQTTFNADDEEAFDYNHRNRPLI